MQTRRVAMAALRGGRTRTMSSMKPKKVNFEKDSVVGRGSYIALGAGLGFAVYGMVSGDKPAQDEGGLIERYKKEQLSLVETESKIGEMESELQSLKMRKIGLESGNDATVTAGLDFGPAACVAFGDRITGTPEAKALFKTGLGYMLNYNHVRSPLIAHLLKFIV